MKQHAVSAAKTAPTAFPPATPYGAGPGSVSACPGHRSGGASAPRSGVSALEPPGDAAQKRAIADAVWTDLLWLMPPGRTVTVTVRDGTVAVELGPPGPAPETPAH